jgi:hypothetical protein
MTKQTEARTIDSALKEFTLIGGVGSPESKKACAMTLLSWVAGRPWTDHPPCAHRILCDIVILGNDADSSTARSRASLVKAGQVGVLDTWWIPGEVIAWAQIRPEGRWLSPHQFAIYVLKRIAKWKGTKGLLGDLDLTSANLRSADLRSANLTSADLRSADLRSANLRFANLTSADLRFANFRSADLRFANLTFANLTSADLTFANLTSADLRSANLRFANFRSADLTSANLRSANLTSANLTGSFGIPDGGLPKGWKLDDSGLWVEA